MIMGKNIVPGQIWTYNTMASYEDLESAYFNWSQETQREDFLTHSVPNFLELIHAQGKKA